MTPWVTLATVQTAEGPLTLKQRGNTFHIVIGGRVLMTSAERRSEEALATLALTDLPKQPRVLIGGLGMAYTLRAALDVLPGNAQVSVAELTPAVEEWCRGHQLGSGTRRGAKMNMTIPSLRQLVMASAAASNTIDSGVARAAPHRPSGGIRRTLRPTLNASVSP